MSVSEPFIRRPIATSLLGIALLIGGMLGYFALPVSALPQVDFPTVQVTTRLPGAALTLHCWGSSKASPTGATRTASSSVTLPTKPRTTCAGTPNQAAACTWVT